nr:SAM-dependent methyltransferase [Falsirhodobacter halotolerans]
MAQALVREIGLDGPISLATFMRRALLDPDHGYYTTRMPFGAAGDFTTAPEISQMFGELIGLCLAQHWLESGGGAFTLAELGPGRGTLMADILRATRNVPGFHAAADVVLVEASPALAAMQAGRVPCRHVARVQDLPDAPLWLVANEFFDALPIRQFHRRGAAWHERMVGVTEGRLAFGLSPPVAGTYDADIVEICPDAAPIMAEIAARVTDRGLALIVDYGGWGSDGDTFQAVRNHAFADPLADVGQADLTAHVDFRALAAAAAECTIRYTTQGALLGGLGIATRAERLAATLSGAALEAHVAAFRRLTEAGQMGELFKAMAVTGRTSPQPPGFP